MDMYFQCSLYRGSERTTGWIEARGAKPNACVKIKGDEVGMWTVHAVHQPPRPLTWLRDKQAKDRSSLRSIKG